MLSMTKRIMTSQLQCIVLPTYVSHIDWTCTLVAVKMSIRKVRANSIKWLDIGSNYGRKILYLINKLETPYIYIVLSDIDQSLIRTFHNHVKSNSKLACNFDAVACASEKLPYKRNSFNIITMFHVIEHLKKPLLSLLELIRTCNKTGIILISTPNRNRIPQIILIPIINLLIKLRNHVCEYTYREVLGLLKAIKKKEDNIKVKFIVIPFALGLQLSLPFTTTRVFVGKLFSRVFYELCHILFIMIYTETN